MSGLNIVVVGASGAAGEQVLSNLAEGRLEVGEVTAAVSRSCRVTEVQLGERPIPVHALEEVLDESFDLAFLCVPESVGVRAGATLAARGARIVALAHGEWPLILPGVHEPELDDVASTGGVRTPSAAAWVVATVLAPLQNLGLTRVTGVLTQSASVRGRPGIEELGSQVVASFNSREAPRRIFEEGLAFDVLAEDTAPDEWSTAEHTLAAELAELLGKPTESIAITLCTGSTFAGVVGGLFLEGLTVEAVEEALLSAPGLRSVQRSGRLRPRALIEKGRTTVSWGRLRADPAGLGVHIWVVGDNLAGAAGSLPIQAARWLVERGLVGQEEA